MGSSSVNPAQPCDSIEHARFNIDLKAPGAVEPLVAALDRHGAHDRVCVGSFGERTIRRFRRLTAGRVPTFASPVEMAVFGLLRGVRRGHYGVGRDIYFALGLDPDQEQLAA